MWGLGRVAGAGAPGPVGRPDRPAADLDDRAAGRLCAVLAGCGEDQVGDPPGRDPGPAARPRPARPRPPRPVGSPGAPCWSPAAPARSAGMWPAGSPPGAPPGSCWPAASGPRPARCRPWPPTWPPPVPPSTSPPATSRARDSLAGLLARIAARGPPLTAVFHAAASGRRGHRQAGPGPAGRGAGGQGGGAAHLDELTAGRTWTRSSCSPRSGDVGRGAGQLRGGQRVPRRAGRAPPCAGPGRHLGGLGPVGGRRHGGVHRRRRVRQRLAGRSDAPMDPGLAIQALEQAVNGPGGTLAVMDVDWARFPAARGGRDLPAPAPARRPARDPPDRGAGQQTGRQALARAGAGRAGGAASGTVPGRAGTDAHRPGPGGGRRGARPRVGRGDRTGPGVQRPGLRLADRGRAAEPARGQHRPAAARHAGLRLPDAASSPSICGPRSSRRTWPWSRYSVELDQLEAILSGIPDDSDIRADVTARLRTVLSKWVGAQGRDAAEKARRTNSSPPLTMRSSTSSTRS